MNDSSASVRADLVRAIPNLRAFAISLCGDAVRADDLVQETLLKAWRHLDSYQEGTNLKAWLFTILRNNFFSEHRKRRLEVEDVDGHLSETLATAPNQLPHMDLADLRAALAKLPADQREALILVGAEGMSYEEVAAIAGCAVGTIKSRVNRARVRLCEMLQIERLPERRAADNEVGVEADSDMDGAPAASAGRNELEPRAG